MPIIKNIIRTTDNLLEKKSKDVLISFNKINIKQNNVEKIDTEKDNIENRS